MTRDAGAKFLIAAWFVFCATRALAQTQQPVTLTGKVTKVEFLNPKVDFYFTEQDHQDKQWKCVTGTPASLKHIGWRADSLNTGNDVTILGDLSGDGSHLSVQTLTAKKLALPKAGKAMPKIACDASPAK